MRLAIRHETTYHYTKRASYTIQLLRLTPRQSVNQRMIEWTIESPGRRSRHVDAYGNATHTMVVDTPHDAVHIVVSGIVEVFPIINGQLSTNGAYDETMLPRESFLVSTPLTAADSTVRAFAQQALPKGLREPADALTLARAVSERIVYSKGATEVGSTASQALALGRGVSQDHAHLFIAACRALSVPARYVSGYFHPGETDHVASHAWADVWFADSGWVSIDVSHNEFPADKHCRVAIGRDYDSASPIRGVRTGGGQEKMTVNVSVQTADWAPARTTDQ